MVAQLETGQWALLAFGAVAAVAFIGWLIIRTARGSWLGVVQDPPVARPGGWQPTAVYDVAAKVNGVVVRRPGSARLGISADGVELTSDSFNGLWVPRVEVACVRLRPAVPPVPGYRTARFLTASGRLDRVSITAAVSAFDELRSLGWVVESR